MTRRILFVMMAVVLCAGMAQAGTRADLSGDSTVNFATTMDMPFMTVGNAGNAGELSGSGAAGGYGMDRITGAVDYVYDIGKFEVTTGQYTEFLNAVAATDTYGLYNTSMWTYSKGSKIERTGSAGSYTYSVAADRADRPVNFVSWVDSARFANWMTNSMPTGEQSSITTEDGSYDLSGTQSYYDPNGEAPSYVGAPGWDAFIAAIMAVTRSPDARYVLPSEDEWYKAAYYDPGKPGGAGYWDYPTGSDTEPSNDLIDPDPGNSACWDSSTIRSPYYRTEAGEFENSASAYGTFDQGGNVFEWNEVVFFEHNRGLRGGSYQDDDRFMRASWRYWDFFTFPSEETSSVGFRVASVPEPATMSLLALGGLAVLRRRK